VVPVSLGVFFAPLALSRFASALVRLDGLKANAAGAPAPAAFWMSAFDPPAHAIMRERS